MRKSAYLVLALLLIMPIETNSFTIAPGATTRGKTKAELLVYLNDLPNRSSKKVLSGQRTEWLNDWPCGHNWDGACVWDTIPTNSGGYYPAIMGVDVDVYHESNAAYDVTRLIDHWNNGGLVFADWFPANPMGTTWSWPLHNPHFPIEDVYTSGNSTYNNFLIHMDKVASLFQTLQDSGVVVLFRPFAEMNAGGCNTEEWSPWSWWGARDYTKLKNLWIYFHNYLTVTKGLTNIIWVFGVAGESGCITDYYPGDAYVDIVGVSFYNQRSGSDIYRVPEYDSLKALGKPFALTELGQCAYDATMDQCKGRDTRLIPSGIKTNMPDTVWWMNWSNSWELGRHTYLSEMFNDSSVIHRADKPSQISISPGSIPSTPGGLRVSTFRGTFH